MKMKHCKKMLGLLVMALIVVFTSMTAMAATVKANPGEKKTLEITTGQSVTLQVTGVKQSKIKWSTSKSAVAKVSKKGKVTTKKTGNVKITAKSGKTKTTFVIKVCKNEYVCANQNPATWTYGSSRVCFNTLKAYYKGGKLYVQGFWSNTEYVNYTKVVADICIYDRNSGNKLIAKKHVTYNKFLGARSYNGKMTYVFSGKELKTKKHDLRNMVPITYSSIY